MWDRFVHDGSGFANQYYTIKNGHGSTHYARETVGECNHNPPHARPKDCDNVKDKIFTMRHLERHLKGERTYAPYQTSKQGQIKWLCIDIDAYGDANEDEVQQCVIDVALKVNSFLGKGYVLVEDSGSKGYHIWLFFTEPVRVGLGYTFGRMVVQDLKVPAFTNIEIYPKHQEHKEHFFGSTVKIPLGIHQKTKARCLFVDHTFNPYEDQWAALAKVKTIDKEWATQNIHVLPVVESKIHTDKQYVPLCLTEIMERGIDEGMRDEAAFRIVCYLRAKGIPHEYAITILEQWNEHNDPPMDQAQLDSKLEQGYGSTYSFFPCGEHRFDKHCHSSCSFFSRKVEKRWFNPQQSPVGVISHD